MTKTKLRQHISWTKILKTTIRVDRQKTDVWYPFPMCSSCYQNVTGYRQLIAIGFEDSDSLPGSYRIQAAIFQIDPWENQNLLSEIAPPFLLPPILIPAASSCSSRRRFHPLRYWPRRSWCCPMYDPASSQPPWSSLVIEAPLCNGVACQSSVRGIERILQEIKSIWTPLCRNLLQTDDD